MSNRFQKRSKNLVSTRTTNIKPRKRAFFNRDDSNKYKMIFLNKHSEHYPKFSFTNFVNSTVKDHTNEGISNGHIATLLRLDNKTIQGNQIPFDKIDYIDFGNDSRNQRIGNLLLKIGAPCTADSLEKANYSPFFKNKGTSNKQGDLLRIIFTMDIDNKIIYIHLVDPYHLAVTSSTNNLYLENKDNSVCFSNLKSY